MHHLRSALLVVAAITLAACGDLEAQRKYEARQAAIKEAEKSVQGLREAGRAMVVLRARLVVRDEPETFPFSATYVRIGVPADTSRFESVGSSIGLAGIDPSARARVFPEYDSESFLAGEYYFSSANGLVSINNSRAVKAEYKTGAWRVAEFASGTPAPDLVLAPGDVVFLGDLIFSGALGDKSSIQLDPGEGDLEAARSALSKTNPGLADALVYRPFVCALCPQ